MNSYTRGLEVDLADALALWDVKADEAYVLAAQLLAMYAASNRFYHTGEHLAETLSVAATNMTAVSARSSIVPGAMCCDRTAVTVALWFHDCVYDATRSDNEARSACFALSSLAAAGVKESHVSEVVRLVKATAGHVYSPDDVNAAVVVDSDLWILASPRSRYKRYIQDVRREYAHVPSSLFDEARRATITDLKAALGSVFTTFPNPQVSRTVAQTNIDWELGCLR